jgi:phospholipase A2
MLLFTIVFMNRFFNAAEPPNKVNYVIACETTEKDKFTELINTYGTQFNEFLGLPPDAQKTILVSQKAAGLSTLLTQLREPIVIIATGYNAVYVFDTIKDKFTIHSIILIDPTVVTRGRTLIATLLDIPYQNITNCVYNFYSESTKGFTRKIRSWYDSGQQRLKGINIKCEYVNALGTREKLNFDRCISTDIKPPLTSIPLAGTLSKIPAAINIINEHYMAENDLSCLLFSRNEQRFSNDQCPLVYINFYSQFEGDKLQTSVYKSPYTQAEVYYDASSSLHPEMIASIKRQKQHAEDFSERTEAIDPGLTRRRGLLERETPAFWRTWDTLNELYAKSFLGSNPPNPHEPATVRLGDTPCKQEQSYIQNREPRVRANLGISADTACPRIAVVASGGGVRAMLSTLGALQGLEDAHLMDAITYVCGLSGSTWAIGPWISSGRNIHTFSDMMIAQLDPQRMINPGDITNQKWENIGRTSTPYYYKKGTNLPYTTVDLYGGYLMQYLLPESLRFIYLSQQSNAIQSGTLPFPIYTAIRADGKTYDLVIPNNRWYEFTPYEIGASWLAKSPSTLPTGMYIPSWSFGRSFSKGQSTDFVFEQPLALNMAIFGSAFAIHVGKAYSELSKKGSIASLLAIPLTFVEENRQITAAAFKNFTFGMATSEISDQPNMQMVDAGLAFNLPYPPVSGEYGNRKADILIFIDASADQAHKGNALIQVAKYASEHNLHFPDLDHDERNPEDPGLARFADASFNARIDTAFRIFMSDNTDAPLVIYIRFARDTRDRETVPTFVETCMQLKGSCNTFNFQYPRPVAEGVITLMKNNIVLNAAPLRQAIMHYFRTNLVQGEQPK